MIGISIMYSIIYNIRPYAPTGAGRFDELN